MFTAFNWALDMGPQPVLALKINIDWGPRPKESTINQHFPFFNWQKDHSWSTIVNYHPSGNRVTVI